MMNQMSFCKTVNGIIVKLLNRTHMLLNAYAHTHISLRLLCRVAAKLIKFTKQSAIQITMIVWCLVFPNVANSQGAAKIRATVRLNTMFCGKTTDGVGPANRYDEVYMLVGGIWSDGNLYKKVLPSEDYPYSQWDFTDQGHDDQYLDPRYTRPGNTPINRPKPFNSELAVGESVSLTIIFMEKDGGEDAERAEKLAVAVQTAAQDHPSVTPYTLATQIVAKGVQVFDQDDLLGVLFIKLSNEDGRLKYTWSVGENASYIGEGENGLPWGTKFQFSPPGGGHLYNTYWSVTQDGPEKD